MKGRPFKNVSKRSWRKTSVNGTRFDFYRNFALPVDRVEVRDPMFTVEHPDYDAEET